MGGNGAFCNMAETRDASAAVVADKRGGAGLVSRTPQKCGAASAVTPRHGGSLLCLFPGVRWKG